MTNFWHSDDAHWMRVALNIGARHIGRCAPNPSVGCVIVRDDQVLASAVTAVGGRPHAEAQALEIAGAAAEGATAYVTLEPCAHHGKTPPCAEALIAAKIARVVIGCGDPHSEVAGKGIALLQQAGVDVVMAPEPFVSEARAQHIGFFTLLEKKRPFVAMKLATSLDGAIATASGESQWITGAEARAHAHGLRSRFDAILTGSGTVTADNPRLTCRLPGLHDASPIRAVLDTHLTLWEDAALLEDAPEIPLLVFASAEAMGEKAEKVAALRAAGAEILPCRMAGDRLDAADALARLGARGITRLLVEAGAMVNSTLVEAGLVDEIHWYRAPILLGRGARQALIPALVSELSELKRWERRATLACGADMLEIFALRQNQA
jgi:diaminohydroxyphosphoribosylaminopyrimidine deaminase/5-amino-6-(5-phosphoribosylamino)uracil reductase